jgi:(p)ppGpp synthase/HD superfamily hydrolase
MLGRRFDEAVAYAAIVHGAHFRKGTGAAGPAVPYIAHLLGVAGLVLEDGGGEDEAVAALLHDAVEDQGGMPRLDDIRRRFGDRVAAIVRAASDAIPEPGRPKDEWWTRKCAHLDHLAHVEGDLADPLLRVTMADKLSNLRATVRDARVRGPEFWAVFKEGPASQVWYYGRMIEIFRARCRQSSMLPELEDLLVQLGRLVPEQERVLAERYRVEKCPPARG